MFKPNWHLSALNADKTCQLLSQILMFAHKSVTNSSKAIDTSLYSMCNTLQTQCSFENMPIIQLVM